MNVQLSMWEELQKAVKDGYEAYVFFVIQMKDVRYFTPNRQTHPEFAEALVEAGEKWCEDSCI